MTIGGLWGIFQYLVFKHKSVPVLLRVRRQKAEFFGGGTFHPEYEVLAGPYKGKTATSSVGTSFGFQRKGAEVLGFYIPSNGKIESQASLNVIFFGSILFVIAGLVWSVIELAG